MVFLARLATVVVAVFLLVATRVAAWEWPDFELPKMKLHTDSVDKMCAHPSNSIWSRFTGFKLYHYYKFARIPLQTTESLRMAYCLEGKKIWDSVLLSDYQENFHFWNRELRIDLDNSNSNRDNPNTFLKFVRNNKFVDKNVTSVYPKIWVGAMLYCIDEKCDRSKNVPILPLYTDDFHKYWYKLKRNRKITDSYIEKFIPFLTTSLDSENMFQALVNHNSSHIINKWQTMVQKNNVGGYDSWTFFEKKRKPEDDWYISIDQEEQYEPVIQKHDKDSKLHFRIDKNVYDKFEDYLIKNNGE